MADHIRVKPKGDKMTDHIRLKVKPEGDKMTDLVSVKGIR